MKLFCNLLTRRRSSKKKESLKLSPSPINILSNNAIQSITQPSFPSDEQTTSLFDQQTKCTCHFFDSCTITLKNLTGNCLTNGIHTKLISIHPISCTSSSHRSSSTNLTCREYSSDMKYILTVTDFCFWYDVRSTVLDLVDRVVAIDETRRRLFQQNPPTVIKLCLPQSNPIHRRIRRPKTSIAIQTSCNYQQRRNAKVQTNTVTLSPLQKPNLSSERLFFN